MNTQTTPILFATNRQRALYECITKDGTNWCDIVAHIKLHYTVKNWMHVRGELQGLINAKLVQRTQDVHNEVYLRINA